MRTTVTLTSDVQAEVDRLRREEGLGTSEAINLLAQRGLHSTVARPAFTQHSLDMGMLIDVSNVAEVLDLLDT